MPPESTAKHRALTESIPEHLRPFITRQDPTLYTPIDHASWRFILRVARAFFSKFAHQKYLDGLKETGISLDRIPLIEEMDQKLRRFGWRAVPVSGFIPPAAFMEFQSLGILPIACEMRTLDHLAYTPAPDIVHEAAGHAPIIADPDYSNYLRSYGEVARKAIYSHRDVAVYEAIRKLSVVKEDPKSTPSDIEDAQNRLNQAISEVDDISEATLLARMNWWTVEYGLVGSIDEPKIYGAGLLSSVGESYHCLSEKVQKIPFSTQCVEMNYDITRPQPQLFVTPNFESLTHSLEEFASTMAYRIGGRAALEKAKRAQTVCTVELDSGLQIGGQLSEFTPDIDFLKFSSPVQLAHQNRELDGHSARFHKDGFSSPIGAVIVGGKERDPSSLTEDDLKLNQKHTFHYKSGITVSGIPTAFLRARGERKSDPKTGRTLLIRFENCTVTRGETVLFKPDWGVFDLACGMTVTSAFGGPADRGPYLKDTGTYEQPKALDKCNLTDSNRALNALYADLRSLRERSAGASGAAPGSSSAAKGTDATKVGAELTRIHRELKKADAQDYLLQLEILEMLDQHGLTTELASLEKEILSSLERISKLRTDHRELIARGLALRGFDDPSQAPVPEQA